jgi:hypothetical protein
LLIWFSQNPSYDVFGHAEKVPSTIQRYFMLKLVKGCVGIISGLNMFSNWFTKEDGNITAVVWIGKFSKLSDRYFDLFQFGC